MGLCVCTPGAGHSYDRAVCGHPGSIRLDPVPPGGLQEEGLGGRATSAVTFQRDVSALYSKIHDQICSNDGDQTLLLTGCVSQLKPTLKIL